MTTKISIFTLVMTPPFSRSDKADLPFFLINSGKMRLPNTIRHITKQMIDEPIKSCQ